MKSLRDSLPEDFLGRMQKELGREETLRLLWPLIVGSKLGANTALQGIRQNTLRVSVPDQTWKKTLGSLEGMILEAVHRYCGEDVGSAIEFVEAKRNMDVVSRSVTPQPKKGTPPRPLASADLPLDDFPLDAIPDPELREMFGRSAQKYFARQRGEEGSSQ